MWILTNRELEFLVSLNTDWRKLYWSELARLQRRDSGDRPADGFRILNRLDTRAQVNVHDKVEIAVD
jgi:hypothetical protein